MYVSSYYYYCITNGERISRHNAIRDVIYGMASQAALSPQLEKQYILPGTQMKPADLFIPTWSAGKPLAIDISVVSPTQSHLLLYNHTQTEKLCAAHCMEGGAEEHKISGGPSQSEHSVHTHGSRNIWWMGVGEQTSFCHSCGQNFGSHWPGKIVCRQSAVPKIGHHIAEATCLCNDCQAAIVK